MARLGLVRGRRVQETGERLGLVSGARLQETSAAVAGGTLKVILAGPGGLVGPGGMAGLRGGRAG